MQKPTILAKATRFAQHIFMHLLKLYPRKYRQAYGRHMAQLFADCSREIAERGSASALLALWASTVLDVCKTALEERIKEVWNMNNEQIQRRASLLLLAGAAILLAVIATGRFELTYDDPLGGPDGWIEYTRLVGMPLSYLLLAAGAWFLGKTNHNARTALLISTIGALTAGAAFALRNALPWWVYPAAYLVFMTGLGIYALGLRKQRPATAWVLTLASFLLPVVAVITLGFQRYWWSRGGANTGFGIQAGLDMINTSQLIAPALLCIAAILLLRNRSAARS